MSVNFIKETRWKKRFEGFTRCYRLLEKYSEPKNITTELERAGVIQFFEMTIELAWKVQKDYLESEGHIVKSPKATIKQSYQDGLIEDGHIGWMR